MIFIGLPSLEASINRVDMRVRAGGHFVDVDNVSKNFSRGLDNLVKFYDHFDSVDILESTIDINEPFKISALMSIKAGTITAAAEMLPDWVKRIPVVIEANKKLASEKSLNKGNNMDFKTRESNDRGLSR